MIYRYVFEVCESKIETLAIQYSNKKQI